MSGTAILAIIILKSVFMKKNLFLSLLLISMIIPTAKSQVDSVTFVGEKGDFLILNNNYAEFRFGSYFGGGYFKQRKNKIVIENDPAYSGRSKSTYLFEANDRSKVNRTHKFIMRDNSNNDISEKAFMILAMVNKKPLCWAESKNGFYELPVKPIPENTIVWLHSFEYYPLKIILDSYPSGTFHVTLAENDSSGIFSYMPGYTNIISCKWQGKDKLVCSYKHHGPGKSPVKSVLFRQEE
jgi:hypothetical protein